jgi:hypothetical protein
VNDDESLDVRWYPLDALPELGATQRSLLAQALSDSREAAYHFSGLANAFG